MLRTLATSAALAVALAVAPFARPAPLAAMMPTSTCDPITLDRCDIIEGELCVDYGPPIGEICEPLNMPFFGEQLVT